MTLQEQISATITFLRGRSLAYKLTFQPNQPANMAVLQDLAQFCRANESCVIPGDRDRSLVLEGRREAWLRIQQNLNLTPEQLFTLYSAGFSTPKET